ncbi:MAG: hypothetical protein K2X87_04840 [Gemmataceae bacterium]|nr:hypothetical protein [Gemmataceae bacterium]
MAETSDGWAGEADAPCAVILTALQLEARAVIARLAGCHDRRDRVGTVYTCGVFRSPHARWRVAVAECGPGNSRAQSVANFAITHFDPAAVLFVGVAGSLKADVLLGDVVASTKVYNYHSGKAEKDFLPRPAVENTSYELEQLARAVARADSWLDRVTERHPDRAGDPRVYVGPIAAGEQVDADARSHTHRQIKRFYGDALAVEMEGYGTLASANIPKVPAIIVRSISDNVVDKAACDGKGWQPVAAHAASAFAFELLANYRVDRPPSATPPPPGPPSPIDLPPGGLPAAGRPTDPLAELRRAVRAASAPLLSWPTDLGRGEWLLRPELRTVRERIDHAPHSATLVLGGPGSGKSALLARLGRDLADRGVPVLAIKADLLTDDVRDGATLGEHLGLGGPAADGVRQLAAAGPVVVLVDQLDALAGVVDLRPGRLNALLNLVRAVAGVANVHVVCSCREFERRRDARLTAVEADVVELSLPTWEQVAEVLAARGVAPAGWPAAFRELLRPPQHLKVFLQGLSDPAEARVFGSYQQMLDDLWEKRVTDPAGPPGRADLVLELAAALAEDEALWVPAARFEDRRGVVEALVGAGVLARAGAARAGVGFSHQTLFEHAWARAFAARRSSLADYAAARQDGLFVRSTVWAGLNYLRGADPAGYRREFGRLWDRADLRRHLRHLLVEFLGTDPDPGPAEEGWLAAALADPALEGRVLAAVRGNPAWFGRLARSHLPGLMRAAGPQSGLLLGVVAAAWGIAREECLRLVRTHWLPDPGKDLLTFHALTQLPSWDAEGVELACAVVGRSPINRPSAAHLAAQVAGSAPDLAPRVVAAALRREVEELERQPAPEPVPPPADPADPGWWTQGLDHRRADGFRRLLEHGHDWYGLDEIAEQSPAAFLREVWPLFVRALEPLLDDRHADRGRYRGDHCLGFDLPGGGEDDHPHPPLPEAIDAAIRSLASRSPEEFAAFLSAECGRDSLTVQRLLARGLAAGLPGTRHSAVGYLLADIRRLGLGPFRDEYRDTVALLAALGPLLTDDEVGRLEAAVLGWEAVRLREGGEDPGWRREIGQINRRHRLRLLAALPFDRLSPPTRNLVGEERVRFPDHPEAGRNRVEWGVIGSPMSADQMGRAKVADLVGLFRGLPDQTGHGHPRYPLRGGSVQAAREFETFAAAHPGRAVAVLRAFGAGRQERPAGAGLVGLAKSGYPDGDLFGLAAELDGRGFRSEEFRVDAARAVGQRARDGVGLPDGVCGLLERWLAEPWAVREVVRAEPNARAADERPRSVLWHPGGMAAVAMGPVTLLAALTAGYLLRRPPAADRWLAALDAHVDRPERAEAWQVLARDFGHLRQCDRAAAVRFLDRLFARHPAVLASEVGAVALTRVWWFAPEADVWRWLAAVRDSGWERAAQAYGELVALRAVAFGDERARAEVARYTGPVADPGPGAEGVRLGVVLAVARLWTEPAARALATDVLVGLIPTAEGLLARAVFDVFTAADDLPHDEPTHRLLAALADHPGVLAHLSDGWVTERLEALLPAEADAVYRICRELVRLRRADLGSLASGWAAHAANLTNIALTLHRLGPDARGWGLELFESLLEAGLPDAESALRELDRRIPSPVGGVMPRPRRRRRRAA